jgi:hypothetical protein
MAKEISKAKADPPGVQSMTIEQLRAAYEETPFRPFVLHLADGREIPVHSREFISPAPNGRTMVVWQPDARMNIIDLLLVTDLEFKNLANGARKRRRGQR